MPFQIHALNPDEFNDLFSLSDEALKMHQARRVTIDTCPGSPCRVSLEDAKVGEEALLIHYEHQPADTPFRSGHAIYVRKNAEQAMPDVDEIPALFRHRLMSIRAFSNDDNMVDAEVADGMELESVLESTFGNADVDYVHLHYAKPGCFAALVVRV